MAKGQKKSNKEVRKPKQASSKPAAPVSIYASKSPGLK